MRSTSLVITLFVAAIALAALHDIALRLNWYYLYPAIDIPLHILGGFVVAIFTYFLMTSQRLLPPYSSHFQILKILLLGTLFISLLWELLELVFFLTKDAGLSIETLSDIAFGLVGAIIAWGAVLLLRKNKTTSKEVV
jgi:hypothetical protein